MSDFILILMVCLTLWTYTEAIEYQTRIEKELVMYDENMAFVWNEAEAITQKLKQCTKGKK